MKVKYTNSVSSWCSFLSVWHIFPKEDIKGKREMNAFIIDKKKSLIIFFPDFFLFLNYLFGGHGSANVKAGVRLRTLIGNWSIKNIWEILLGSGKYHDIENK